MAEEHVKAMEVIKRKKQEYTTHREGIRQTSGRTTVIDNAAINECQLLLLEISYLESRVLSLSQVDLGFIA